MKLERDNERFDVLRRRVIRRVTADILLIFVLIDTDPINTHGCGQDQVLKVNATEIKRESKVGNDVLTRRSVIYMASDRRACSPSVLEAPVVD